MKITICGSIAFYGKMEEIKAKLESKGHEVKIPPNKITDDKGNPIDVMKYYELRKAMLPDGWIWDRKETAIIEHFKKVDWSDMILVLNYDKNGIEGYVGANTLMEMGLALYLNKKIFMLNKIPEISYREEILGMKPVVLNGDLAKLEQR